MIFHGTEVKRLRESRGMTQRQLAALIGMNDSEICRIENGERNPLATTAARLAKAFDVPIEHLVHD
jgi:transcriptional regulator with XRE-family HTH domain